MVDINGVLITDIRQFRKNGGTTKYVINIFLRRITDRRNPLSVTSASGGGRDSPRLRKSFLYRSLFLFHMRRA